LRQGAELAWHAGYETRNLPRAGDRTMVRL